MKKIELALLLGLILAITLSSFTEFGIECNEVREDTLRLHILANSNSQIDQEAKLYVRDCLLSTCADLFAACPDKEGAVSVAADNVTLIEETARKALAQKGLYYEVKAKIENMYFATTEYADFTLPAGRYDAVRLELGFAQGKNWFCVLFPPLCLPAAMDDAAEYSLSESKVVSGKHKIKFALVEMFAKRY